MKKIEFKVWTGEKMVSLCDEGLRNYLVIGLTWTAYRRDGSAICQGGLIKSKAKLLQFTGFKDKNNKDIYEGDIVKFEHDEEICGPCSYPKRRKYLGQVVDVYLIQHAKPSIFKEYREKLIKHCQGKKIEIIGNIFENPELLK